MLLSIPRPPFFCAVDFETLRYQNSNRMSHYNWWKERTGVTELSSLNSSCVIVWGLWAAFRVANQKIWNETKQKKNYIGHGTTYHYFLFINAKKEKNRVSHFHDPDSLVFLSSYVFAKAFWNKCCRRHGPRVSKINRWPWTHLERRNCYTAFWRVSKRV